MHRSPAPENAGYTLLELLVVIAVISIILSMTTLAITSGSPQERLQTEAQRFSALFQLAQDEALLNASEMGIAVTEDSYQFLLLEENQWLPLSQDNSFRQRVMPEDIRIELELDYQHTELESRVSKIGEVSKVGDVEKFENETKDKLKPKIYLLSSGELAPPFRLQFYIPGRDLSVSIDGSEDGSLKLEYHAPG